jgi:hypothetical protein
MRFDPYELSIAAKYLHFKEADAKLHVLPVIEIGSFLPMVRYSIGNTRQSDWTEAKSTCSN